MDKSLLVTVSKDSEKLRKIINFWNHKKFKKFKNNLVNINNFKEADSDDSIRVAITRHPFTRLRSAWRDKSRKFLLDNGDINVELFRKWGRKGDPFSRFFGEGKDPYAEEATEVFQGHADNCEKVFGKYSKTMIQNMDLSKMTPTAEFWGRRRVLEPRYRNIES